MEDNKVNVKLEKHLWPDQLQKRRKRRAILFLVILGLIFTTVFGYSIGRLQKQNPSPIIDHNQDSFETQKQYTKFQYIYEILANNWYFSRDMENPAEEIMDNAIKGMIEGNGDIHTAYMSEEEIANFEDGINQNFVGIGVQFYQVDGYSIVLKVFNNSPAEKAGVMAGDIFYRVDGVDVTNISTTEISDMVRGEKNTDVNIVFLRNNEEIEMTITRAAISSTSFAKMLDSNIGYLEINSFGLSTANEVKSELDMMVNQGMNKLIIDVRDNGGGYLSALNEIASFFLEKGQVIIAQEDVEGNISETLATGNNYPQITEIVMLINENSASASEVLAMALRDNLNIELVGTKTYGKGTVQTTLPLSDGSALKYTIAQWLTPNGERIHEEGIEPTIEVKIHEVFHITTPTLDETESLGVDEVSESLVFVQQALDFLGYNPGRTDGYFSQQTLDAIHAYQEAYQERRQDVINQETIVGLSSRVYQYYNQNIDELDIQLEKAIELLQ